MNQAQLKLRNQLIERLESGEIFDWDYRSICSCAIHEFDQILGLSVHGHKDREALLGLTEAEHDDVFYYAHQVLDKNDYEITPEDVAKLLRNLGQNT